MKPQAYQKPTIYNSDGTKAQIGTYDIRTDPLTNSKADGILDYINNNLEALHDKAGNYLPLSGGTMTGVIGSNTSSAVDATGTTRYEETLSVGKDKNNSNLGSDFYSAYNVEVFHGIRAGNPNITGSNWSDMRIHVSTDKKRWISADWHGNLTDGTQDNSNHIPTTSFIHSNYLSLAGGTLTGVVNGVTPPAGDNSTKIATTEFVNAKAENYLPLTGGTMSGGIEFNGANIIAIKRNNGNGGVWIIGGDTDNHSGATLQLYGQTNDSYAGRFYLRASTKSNVFDKSHPSIWLEGHPNGYLAWGGKEVERVNASGSGYIRYDSGIQICWGVTSAITTATTVTVTLPALFVNTDYKLAGGRWLVSPAAEEYYFKDKTTTNFKLVTIGSVGGDPHAYMYIAIGKWE